MTFKWSPALAVGVKEIDSQHKELFKKVNDLLIAMRNSKGKEEIKETLRFMEEYTIKHFATEEKIMENYKYPGLEEQKIQHHAFMKRIHKMKSEYKIKGITSHLVILVETKICEWLIKHTGDLDQKIGEYLRKNNLV